MYTDLISDLREEAEWAKGNEWETPIMLSDHLMQAIDAIEAQDKRILTLQHEMMAEAESHIAEVNRLNKQIKELQADMRPVVRGHWVWDKENWWHKCSACGMTFNYDGTYELFDHGFQFANYCPNCGADMRETAISAEGKE